VAAGTPVGLRAKAIMDRGELVPDDVVVAIIADRVDQADANRGFVLDGFPRTVPQAQALDRLLAERGLGLDGVIELKVDEIILIKRIETRVAQMAARGEKLRADDNPDVLRGRLVAYRAQTAPLTDYYASKGMLKIVDGMAAIDDVTKAINRLLSPAKSSKGKTKAKSKAPKGKPAKDKAAPAKRGKGRTAKGRAGAKAGRKAAKNKKKPGLRKNRTKRRLTKAR